MREECLQIRPPMASESHLSAECRINCHLNLTVPVATAVVCTTIISCAVNGVGNRRESKNPISADCNDILGVCENINPTGHLKSYDPHADPPGLQTKV